MVDKIEFKNGSTIETIPSGNVVRGHGWDFGDVYTNFGFSKSYILSLEPGQELDALVAEHVLRWRVYRSEHNGYELLDDEIAFGYPPDDEDDCVPFDIDAYSKNISAAWKVFEHVADPNRTSIHPCGNGATGLYYAVYYDDEMIAHGRSAPEAICKYALIIKLGLVLD